jgi:hypothetical protein
MRKTAKGDKDRNREKPTNRKQSHRIPNLVFDKLILLLLRVEW